MKTLEELQVEINILEDIVTKQFDLIKSLSDGLDYMKDAAITRGNKYQEGN